MLRTLLEPFDLSSSQHNEMAIAYDEDPEGFAALVARVSKAKNPAAALIATVRKGEHVGAISPAKGRSHRTLHEIAEVAVTAYRSRIAAYPPIDERGWTDDDAIVYGVWVASTWTSHYSQDDIEREMRILIGKPWTADQDPALGTGCPPELLAEILAKLGRVGAMPEAKVEPAPPAVDDLAARLLATLGKAA